MVAVLYTTVLTDSVPGSAAGSTSIIGAASSVLESATLVKQVHIYYQYLDHYLDL
ncbi:hypothetical protein [Patiriisocius sp. Uisw_047]|uniref:hypothetical protein n=1 Tax=Patiriisocius sp. Uisw_047 TaxID=3230969 RepID=UPI0039E9056B